MCVLSINMSVCSFMCERSCIFVFMCLIQAFMSSVSDIANIWSLDISTFVHLFHSLNSQSRSRCQFRWFFWHSLPSNFIYVCVLCYVMLCDLSIRMQKASISYCLRLIKKKPENRINEWTNQECWLSKMMSMNKSRVKHYTSSIWMNKRTSFVVR